MPIVDADEVTPAGAGTGRRVGLDRSEVVACALALVEAEGPDALTMRRLAAELDVTTTTIYWHIGSRAELVTAVVTLQSELQAAREVVGKTARDRVMSATRHVWAAAQASPEVTSLAHQSGTTTLLELPLAAALVRELEAAGVRGPAAADALRSILLTVGGFLVLALRSTDTIAPQHTSQKLWSEATETGISAETLEALSRPHDLDAMFEDTIRTVVNSHVPAA